MNEKSSPKLKKNTSSYKQLVQLRSAKIPKRKRDTCFKSIASRKINIRFLSTA